MSEIKDEEQKLNMLREIGNIGAGNASKALSEISGQKIDVDFPSVESVKVEEIPEKLGDRSQIFTDVSVTIHIKQEDEETAAGHLLLLMKHQSAKNLADILEDKVDQPLESEDIELNEEEKDALKETGNILTGASVSAITEYIDLKLKEGIPKIHNDMLGAILDNYLLGIAKKDDEALIFNTEFKFDEAEIDAHFLILFKPEGEELVLNRMQM